ncbi:MAG: histidine phosphatase family protein [Clostridia bacterium]|nr:histidine phosphatase family protein [Clostridia bacterium]
MSFYFARHGETDWNTAKKIQGAHETALNENGLRQADMLLQTLRQSGTRIEAVYTSRQGRAYTTAEIAAKGFGAPLKAVDGLEEMSLGVFEGHNWNEVMAMYPGAFGYWTEDKRNRRPPEGETYQEVVNRLADAMRIILNEYDTALGGTGDVLIVSHGAVLLSLLTVLRELDFRDSYRYIEIRNAVPIKLERPDLMRFLELAARS